MNVIVLILIFFLQLSLIIRDSFLEEFLDFFFLDPAPQQLISCCSKIIDLLHRTIFKNSQESFELYVESSNAAAFE